ncbi:hypothetical protein JHK82_052419 [Glycine max]|nr:hypothetical protein JHK86_052257 [Glycine max]KAG4926627.1 hypothetical protein JHK85_053113 [Glycine max]KAG5082259.1 hypothetical protein JHK84_052297 [Glycine max]KAG5085022.1 hypothetical protein JHK82_052419 [Glycine max]
MYLPKSQADKKKSLLGSSPDFSEAQVTSKVVDESEDDNDSNDDGSVEWASYWKPNITINLVADFTHIVVGVKQEEQIDHYEDQASIKQFLVSSYEQNLYPLLKQEIQQNHRELAFLNSGTPRSNIHEDGIHIIEKLKEMHQILSRRFEHEKHKLQLNTGSKDLSAFAENSAAYCSFTPIMLCEKFVFEAWQDTFLTVDYTSLFWDMKLLQKLTSIHLDDLEELHQASTIVFATPKDIVDPECMGISGFRLV